MPSGGGSGHQNLGGRTQGMITTRRLLLQSSEATGRMMLVFPPSIIFFCLSFNSPIRYAYKDVAELAGFTARVSLLLDTFEDVNNDKYEKVLVSHVNPEILQQKGNFVESEEIEFKNVPMYVIIILYCLLYLLYFTLTRNSETPVCLRTVMFWSRIYHL
jgi:ATP-binding cassette subfamily D (ALD) long-chain fatty acid import protein